MIYLIYGNQTPTIKARVKKIVKESIVEMDEMNYVKFDASNVFIHEIIDECNYIPLGYDKKVVVAEDCYFFLKPKPKNKIESEQIYEDFEKYLECPNEDCDLILTVTNSKIDTSSKYYKRIQEIGKIYQIADPDISQWNQYVEQYCRSLNMNIDSFALQELANRTEGDVASFQNNAKKLALYSNNITLEDVNLMVTRPLEDEAYNLFNYLMQQQNEKALALFRDLKVLSVEPITLISMLSNQFRLLNQITYLSNRRMNNDQIANTLNIKSGRVYAIKKSASMVSSKTIIKTLDDLYNLDLQIKSGQIDRFYAFELFLINFKRR